MFTGLGGVCSDRYVKRRCVLDAVNGMVLASRQVLGGRRLAIPVPLIQRDAENNSFNKWVYLVGSNVGTLGTALTCKLWVVGSNQHFV